MSEQEVIVNDRRHSAAVTLPQATAISPMEMVAMAVRQGADLDKIKQLMELQERHEANEARRAFNEAFAAFKSEAIRIFRKKSVASGPLEGKKYAELYSIVDAVAPALSKHGLSHAWKITKDEKDWIEVTCTIKHSAGHSESVPMGGPPDTGGSKNSIQARASTVTYLQKYTLKAICGVSEQGDDSDGNSSQPELSHEAADWIASIADCISLPDLQAKFNEAFKDLTSKKDNFGKNQLIKAKDARKKELSQ